MIEMGCLAMKYAVLVLGLLVADTASAICYTADSRPECRAEEDRHLQALSDATERSEMESRANYERSQPIQVITPNSSYLAYPSPDGRAVQIYDRTE
jgi:hypothetical protein